MAHSTTPPAVASIDAPRLALFNPEAAAADNRLTARNRKAKTKVKTKVEAKAKAKDFPLTQRTDGRWCKKIRQQVYYFGRNRDEALAEWLRVKDDLLAGRKPRVKTDGLLLADLCDRFLNAKLSQVVSGELSPRTFTGYRQATDRLIAQFGKTRRVDDLASDDFESLKATVSKTRGLVGIENAIRETRIVFKYALDAGLIDRPVRFGPTFRVKRDKIRKAAAGKPPRMFSAADICRMLAEADETMQAMILLGVNCAMGQTDLASLPQSAIDLKGGCISFPRVKTGVERKSALWPETVEAIRKAIPLRPEPKDAADTGLLFITKYGRRFTRTSDKGGPIDGIAQEFGKLLSKLKIKRPGLQFYALRHTFRTVADETRDFPAIDRIMGHSDHTMGGRYREYIDDVRLKAVAEYVRGWLFSAKGGAR